MDFQQVGFVVVWEFRVTPGLRGRFEQVYGPTGAWARLFERDSAYRGTKLIRDVKEAGRYLTVDSWASEEAYDAFKQTHADAYHVLDTECESLTERETEIGRFAGVVS